MFWNSEILCSSIKRQWKLVCIHFTVLLRNFNIILNFCSYWLVLIIINISPGFFFLVFFNWDFIWKQLKGQRTIKYMHFCYFKTSKRSILKLIIQNFHSQVRSVLTRFPKIRPPPPFKNLDPPLVFPMEIFK